MKKLIFDVGTITCVTHGATPRLEASLGGGLYWIIWGCGCINRIS